MKPPHDHYADWLFASEPMPFSNPATYWVDVLRIICIIVGTTLVGTCISEARQSRGVNRLRTVSMLCISLFALSAILTEIGRLGDYPTIRIFVNLMGCTTGVYAMRMLNYRIGGRRVFPPTTEATFDRED